MNKKDVFYKALEFLLVLWFISLVSFFLVQIAPGDVSLSLLKIDSVAVTTDDLLKVQQEFGLNDPIYIKYFKYMKSILQLDLGESLVTGRTVSYELWHAFSYTLALCIVTVFFTLMITCILSFVSAIYEGSLFDKLTKAFCLLGVSMPTFWLSLILMNIFSVQLQLLPATGFAGGFGLVLPAVCLTIALSPPFIQVFRDSIVECNKKEYIVAARSRGISEKVIYGKHILKGSLIPVITMLGVSIVSLLGGSMIVEVIYGLPGLGKLVVDSIMRRDYAMVQGLIFFIGVISFFINSLVDLSYRYFNPASFLKENKN